MKLFRNAVLVVLGYLVSSAAVLAADQAADLAGYWKNDDQPAWIEISFENDSGTGTVRRNEKKPEAAGRILLKDLVADENDPGSWRGQVYAERLKEYKDAEISLPDPDTMQIKVKVGFMSRTVSWTRATAIPTE